MWSFWCSWENWGFCWQVSLLVICVPMYQVKQLKIKSNLQNTCLPLGDYTSRCFKGMGKTWSQICKCRFKFCNSWELASTNWKWGSEYYALSFRMWARVLKTWAHRACHLADNKDCTRIQNQKHKPSVRAPEQTERTWMGINMVPIEMENTHRWAATNTIWEHTWCTGCWEQGQRPLTSQFKPWH